MAHAERILLRSTLLTSHKTALLQLVLLGIIFLAGIGIRLYDLTDPPLDFHATRQLRSAQIARAVYYRLDSGADAQTRALAEELARLEVYEPPILENIVGFTNWVVGADNFWMGRIFNSLFWAIGGLALVAIGRKFFSFYTVVLGLAFYFFLPFSVIASRSFQPEPWMVMWILLTAYGLCRWSEKPGWKWALIAAALGGTAMLVKAVAGLFVAGMLVVVVIQTLGWRRFFRSAQVWVMGVIMLAPTLVYYLAFQTERSAGFLSFWTGALSHLILTTNFYADWLAMVKGLMGLAVFLLALLGALMAAPRLRSILIGLWVGYALYGLIFPYQYTTHEYYHLPLVAIAAVGIMPVLDSLFASLQNNHWFWKAAVGVVFVFACGYNLWVARSILHAADFRTEPTSWRRVGEAIPAGSTFAALTNDYGVRLSYYGWRHMNASWPSRADLNLFSLAGSDPLKYESYFKEQTSGKDYFLVTAFSELEAQSELKALLSRYPIYAEGDGYILYDLRTPENP